MDKFWDSIKWNVIEVVLTLPERVDGSDVTNIEVKMGDEVGLVSIPRRI